jgi:hypothetical protein
MNRGGAENGDLQATYDQFEAYGVDRKAIGPAIRELTALGFLEANGRNRAGSSWTSPSASAGSVPFNDAVPFAPEWR